MQFGTDTYREGAEARIEDARVLLRNEKFSGSFYIAGLAVEGMLRSLVWLEDKRFDQRHDLRKLADRVAELGLLRKGDADHGFVTDAQAISRLWSNDLRFAGDLQVGRWLRSINVMSKDVDMKKAANDHFSRCHRFFKRCSQVWEKQKSRKRSSGKSSRAR